MTGEAPNVSMVCRSICAHLEIFTSLELQRAHWFHPDAASIAVYNESVCALFDSLGLQAFLQRGVNVAIFDQRVVDLGRALSEALDHFAPPLAPSPPDSIDFDAMARSSGWQAIVATATALFHAIGCGPICRQNAIDNAVRR